MREWKKIEGFDFKEIIFEEYHHIAKITINRERYRNAFTPLTTWEMSQAFSYCRESQNIRVVILTGAGDKAFCAGGDMHVKGRGGYVGTDGVPRLNVLDVQMQIRRLPKPVIAMVNGYAIGGGHVLHVMCDLTIASENAIFGQTGPKVGSFDAGFGASYLARMVGQKKAREIWFLCRQYSAREAEEMGMVNKVVPLAELEDTCVEWAEEMMERSPLALRMIKAGFNADTDGLAGIQELAGNAIGLFYMTEEGREGRDAWLERIPVRSGERVEFVDVDDIVWIKASGNTMRRASTAPRPMRRAMDGRKVRWSAKPLVTSRAGRCSEGEPIQVSPGRICALAGARDCTPISTSQGSSAPSGR